VGARCAYGHVGGDGYKDVNKTAVAGANGSGAIIGFVPAMGAAGFKADNSTIASKLVGGHGGIHSSLVIVVIWAQHDVENGLADPPREFSKVSN